MESVNETSPADRRKANKAELAVFFGVSPQAVDGWIRRGCPAVTRGGPGKRWVFDLLDVAKWRFGPEGGPQGTGNPDTLSPRDRLDHFRAERERTKHLAERGDLLPAVDFERALSEALKLVAVSLESLPDVLERDAGIDGAAVERCQVVIDRIREDLYQRLTAHCGE